MEVEEPWVRWPACHAPTRPTGIAKSSVYATANAHQKDANTTLSFNTHEESLDRLSALIILDVDATNLANRVLEHTSLPMKL